MQIKCYIVYFIFIIIILNLSVFFFYAHCNFFYTMIDDDVRKICQRNLVSDSFDRYLDNTICLKTKDRKKKSKLCKLRILIFYSTSFSHLNGVNERHILYYLWKIPYSQIILFIWIISMTICFSFLKKYIKIPSLCIVTRCQVYCSKIVHTDNPIKIQHFPMLGTKIY
jgi:hypothetical protein